MRSDMAPPATTAVPVAPVAVIIPTLNAAAGLAATLDSLTPLAPREVLVADGGSTDDTAAIACRHGAAVLAAPCGRGTQLAAGAMAATAPWLLFLHADTRLDADAVAAVRQFVAMDGTDRRAGYFRFRLDHDHVAARRLEYLVRARCRRFGLPYGDQGLLLHRALYQAVGGFRPLPLMEDVDLVRRLGRRRLAELPGEAVTSAERYRRDGYWRRSARNLLCLSLYLLGVPPERILRLYRR